MSSHHSASPIVDLVAEFCARNQLAEPREDWHRNIVHEKKERADAATNDRN
jgi:hypothetical protein